MSLQDLQNTLQEQANEPGSAITISAAIIAKANLQAVTNFDTTLQKGLVLKTAPSIVVSEPIPAPTGDTLEVSGTTTYLALQDVPVTVTFTVADGGLTSLSLDITIPKGWSFADNETLYGTDTQEAHYRVEVNSGSDS
jgi:hypothetical protein